jgi:hypothetical protein
MLEEEPDESSAAATSKWDPSAKPGELLRTVAFLKKHSLEELSSQFGVRARRDKVGACCVRLP